jgi:hypothetical protein
MGHRLLPLPAACHAVREPRPEDFRPGGCQGAARAGNAPRTALRAAISRAARTGTPVRENPAVRPAPRSSRREPSGEPGSSVGPHDPRSCHPPAPCGPCPRGSPDKEPRREPARQPGGTGAPDGVGHRAQVPHEAPTADRPGSLALNRAAGPPRSKPQGRRARVAATLTPPT